MIYAALAAFIVTLVTVPLVQKCCHAKQLLDCPGPLKIHTQPVPRLGGVAVLLGVLAGVLAARPHDSIPQWPFFAALALIWIVGVVDDVRGAHPAFRLATQLTAAAMLWYNGWRFALLPGGIASFIAVCLLVVLFVNSCNFLDGSDGLASGVACIVALAYFALPKNVLSPAAFALASSTTAACGAFLFSNFPPASIYLGDSGSTLLGFIAAFLGLDLAKSNIPTPHAAALFPCVVTALPILDALRIVAARIARGQSPTVGDRSHFYDATLARGRTPSSVALISWCVTAVCGGIGVLMIRGTISAGWSLLAFSLSALWIGIGLAHEEKPIGAYEKAKTVSSP